MPRYQFWSRGHIASMDTDSAISAAKGNGGKHVRVCYPLMSWGIGSNQPLTVSFTAIDDTHAKSIAEAFGEDDAFVETRERTPHFV